MSAFLKAILVGVIFSFVMQTKSVLADDTELYVLDLSTQAGVQPRVMIIFDNSGSMDSSVDASVPFTPTTTYTKIFWSTDGTVPQSNSSQFFYTQYNNCNASVTALNSVGFYADHFRSVQKQGNKWRWQDLRTNANDYVDCQMDITKSDMANPGSPSISGYPLNGSFSNMNAAYGTTGTKASFATATASYLYTSDYVDWYYTGRIQTSTRLAVAQKTIADLITSTPSVDYGLTTFNMNNNASNTPGTDDGGRIVFASKNANDTASTTDTNAGYRQALIDTVNSLSAETWTPLSETFYEVTHYWQGGSVWKGKWNGTPPYDPTAMLAGLTQYKTPFDSCHNHGYIILITDGEPTHDTAANALITSEYINNTKLTNAELADWGKSMNYYEGSALRTSYLPSLAGYLKNKDQSASLSGTQSVSTYTIGFGNDAMVNAQALLTATATQGGGKYYGAADATALGDALRNILIDILSGQYSMLAPTTASSTMDRSQYLNNLYYSIFVPGDGPAWVGNIKKLKYSDTKGYIVDKNDEAAISSEGKINSSATTVWSTDNGDGGSIEKGGVQSMLANKTNRTIYTNNGTTLTALNRTNLTTIAGSDTQLVTDLDVADTTQIDTQINWILGKDVDGTTTSANRKTILADMMHSKPLVINYGQSTGATNPDLRIVVGTNAGFLHMFKDSGDTVDESWAFIPYPLLKNQMTLRENDTSNSHLYGLDGNAISYILDNNNDGLITSGGSGDKAWVFIGQRQGGRSYYALNVTNPNSPSLKWIITGGITSGFDRLAYTWSTPQVTKIPGEANSVVIFTGGYTGAGTSAVGNAIYIVDADTGALKFKVSPDATSSTNLQMTTMVDSMPGGVALMDSDGDGVSDRLYATDTGGNVWRMDMSGTDKTKWSMFKFASLGSDSIANQDRRFFYAPMIVRTINKKITKNSDSTYSYSEMPFDAVLLGSGDREYPISEKIVKNAYFMLRDYQIGSYLAASTKPAAIVISNLYDITTMPNTADFDVLAGLTGANGWVYWLTGTGEKVFGSGAVVDGTLYFSSFVPEASQSQDVCSLGTSIGTTRVYSMNMHYGTYSSSGTNTDPSPFKNTNNLLIENLSIYVGSDKKIRLLGGPGDLNGTTVTGTTLTTGTTMPKKEYQFIHEN
ncbi:PilC/PilY family type IV pilus protein [uncultured Tolumonas sp.]|uniref:pilus assembly protein n=1 Tax=uncultured Tolumonas sp. TaxID=263765 RepID=UPI00292E9B57|nr:PilC/PilY family type IV pilus protein [uncultured Tolumonas sp.]